MVLPSGGTFYPIRRGARAPPFSRSTSVAAAAAPAGWAGHGQRARSPRPAPGTLETAAIQKHSQAYRMKTPGGAAAGDRIPRRLPAPGDGLPDPALRPHLHPPAGAPGLPPALQQCRPLPLLPAPRSPARPAAGAPLRPSGAGERSAGAARYRAPHRERRLGLALGVPAGLVPDRRLEPPAGPSPKDARPSPESGLADLFSDPPTNM